MLLRFPEAARDPLWALTAAFNADTRPFKLDLGLGVFRDENGATPVLNAVHEVEERLAAEAPSKTYRSLSGNAAFNAGMTRLLLGEGEPAKRAVTLQTVGGTGALRVLADLVATANPSATVWLSDPGYVNHRPIMRAAGLAVANYPWTERNGAVDLDPLIAALEKVKAGDILLVQGCCHNPTGLDLDAEGWAAVANLCVRRGLIPLVDMAYQGLGEGLEQDAFGLRHLAARLEIVLAASSCSKNMGLYCERTGAATFISADPASLSAAFATMQAIARRNYSMPPEHGAAIAAALMHEPQLWHRELAAMRQRILGVRRTLADALRNLDAPTPLLSVERHKGMFSMLPVDPSTMTRLREEFAVYGTSEGRINVAGLTAAGVDHLAKSLVNAVARSSSALPLPERAIS